MGLFQVRAEGQALNDQLLVLVGGTQLPDAMDITLQHRKGDCILLGGRTHHVHVRSTARSGA